MPQQTEAQPAAVSQTTQAGTTDDRWWWVKPWVWTTRMLTALEQGVKGGTWFSLFDKVFAEKTLYQAARHVTADPRKAAGVDHVTPEHYERHLLDHVRELVDELRDDTYRPQPVRRCWIPKLGSPEKRPLGIPTVRDRVVQTALRDVLEPIFERDFAEHSYGFRPGHGCQDALRRVDGLLKAGYTIVVDVDLKSYFDTIPHEKLLERIREKVSDGRVLSLLEQFLKQGILDGLREWTPEEGSPQGAVISPLLSNIYLDPLDHLLAERGFAMVRYADDFVILCRSREEAAAALAIIQAWTAEAGLTLHPTKTKIVDAVTEGFDFLGYRFEHGDRFPRAKSLKKLQDTIRLKTRRAHGQSLEFIIADVNRTLRGWFGYFKHVTKRYVFKDLDVWVRMRLRSLLRKRSGRRGTARRGKDCQRWNLAFFATQGLYNLTTAHVLACQSSPRSTTNWRAGCGKSACPVRREGEPGT
jgi:RNA-directed DNA polymerase